LLLLLVLLLCYVVACVWRLVAVLLLLDSFCWVLQLLCAACVVQPRLLHAVAAGRPRIHHLIKCRCVFWELPVLHARVAVQRYPAGLLLLLLLLLVLYWVIPVGWQLPCSHQLTSMHGSCCSVDRKCKQGVV
jgi:hypothetical protein